MSTDERRTTVTEPTRARSKIGMMQNREKARSDTGARRPRSRWGCGQCAKCGKNCQASVNPICSACRIPKPYIPENWTPTTEHRDLLSDETRRRLERLDRREPLDDPPD